MDLSAYADQWSVKPGDVVRLMVSTDSPRYDADVIRHGATTERIETRAAGTYHGRTQSIHTGSYATVPDSSLLRRLRSFTIQMWIWPTTPGKNDPQGLLTRWSDADQGFGLFVESGGLSLWLAGADGERLSLRSGRAFDERAWYFVAACYDAHEGRVTLYQSPSEIRITDPAPVTYESISPGSSDDDPRPLLIAAAREPSGYLYNGKIDSPRLFARALDDEEMDLLESGAPPGDIPDLIAAWDFSDGISTQQINDTSGHNLHGQLVNMPVRAMTGHNWDGASQSFREAPEQWGGIHFHEDDLDDAGWEADFELQIPDELESGVYSVVLTAQDMDWHVPLFVGPAESARRADIALLVPTLTYLAYANHRYVPGLEQELVETMTLLDEAALDPRDRYLGDHPEFGLSLYASHTDGSGVCYSSRLRPIPNLHPEYRWWGSDAPRHLSADLELVRWLEHKDFCFDVITDEDLHREGAELLSHYRVAVTGSHPEYWTSSMLGGLRNYLTHGGRLMYLGGNGFYWVTTLDEPRLHAMEIRRGWAATRAWQSMPGEGDHGMTGEPGGLWRHRGWRPRALVGVGTTAMGWGEASGYFRQEDSFHERAAFIFDGIGDDEVIGGFKEGFSTATAGAAGDEIDRLDFDLGTPRHALLLASSLGGHSGHYQPFVEDIQALVPGVGAPGDPRVRADMVYFETPDGGAVFSVGSINWILNLPYNGYRNNVSRLTENVLRRFVS